MGIKNAAKKTIAYAKRNGAKAAFFAAFERVSDTLNEKYDYIPLSEDVLEEQKREYKSLAESGGAMRFSIVVPLFNTPEKYLKEMIDSVVAQTYGNWELVLADASLSESETVKEYTRVDPRIKYYHLGSNDGISENTNKAIEKAKGDYIGLLDHDDTLTPDALYEVARVIRKSMKQNKLAQFSACPIRLIYSDEDKYDDGKGAYYEHHAKPSFNMDYLLSNNYICHFAVMRADILKRLKLRGKYDGAQDFDLFLRCCTEAALSMAMASGQIAHIDKVLYHWRCHRGSTAANPASKMYAYEAGQRAVRDVLHENGVKADVAQMPHLGFYRVLYEPDVFSLRSDVGIIGGKILNKRGRIISGNFKKDGSLRYKGLPLGYSGGFQHRAVLQQDCAAVDVRCMAVRPELRAAYQQITGFEYKDTFYEGGETIDDRFKAFSEETIAAMSLKLGEEARKQGFRVMWDPQVIKRV